MAEILRVDGSLVEFTGDVRPAGEIGKEIRGKGFLFHEKRKMEPNPGFEHKKWEKYDWMLVFQNEAGESIYVAITESEDSEI